MSVRVILTALQQQSQGEKQDNAHVRHFNPGSELTPAAADASHGTPGQAGQATARRKTEGL